MTCHTSRSSVNQSSDWVPRPGEIIKGILTPTSVRRFTTYPPDIEYDPTGQVWPRFNSQLLPNDSLTVISVHPPEPWIMTKHGWFISGPKVEYSFESIVSSVLCHVHNTGEFVTLYLTRDDIDGLAPYFKRINV